jgi:hypothetical protein
LSDGLGGILGITMQSLDKTMYVSQHPKVSNKVTIKLKYGSSVPPDVTSSWLDTKQLPSMVSMKSELAEDLWPFFSEGQNVRRVLTKRSRYELDVSNELLMTN